MKGIKFIFGICLLGVLSYFGMLFLDANRDKITVEFWGHRTAELSIGMMLFTSFVAGMLLVGVFYLIFVTPLLIQNRNLRRALEEKGGPNRRHTDPKPIALEASKKTTPPTLAKRPEAKPQPDTGPASLFNFGYGSAPESKPAHDEDDDFPKLEKDTTKDKE